MLSADYIIGCRGDFKIAANEVAIGMTMPRVAAAVLRNRLQPAAFQRAVTVAQYFDPDAALAAGFFDELVYSNELMERARQKANEFRELDDVAHTVSKRRIRASLTRRLRFSVPLDLFDAMLIGLRRRR
jgi:enoyl-CoA hydratase